jgi:multidrug efflux pump subunit AcrA (membrane-fusion protein)
MDVKVVTLAEKPIAQSSEYIATLKSLRSTTIQPQVEGIVTRVLVASGARVRPGQTILQLEASKRRRRSRASCRGAPRSSPK